MPVPARTSVGTVGLDDPAADRRPEVAAEGLVDLGAEALVTEDEGDLLQEFVTVQPAPASGRLAERRQDGVGVDQVDGNRAGERFGGERRLDSLVGPGRSG